MQTKEEGGNVSGSNYEALGGRQHADRTGRAASPPRTVIIITIIIIIIIIINLHNPWSDGRGCALCSQSFYRKRNRVKERHLKRNFSDSVTISIYIFFKIYLCKLICMIFF